MNNTEKISISSLDLYYTDFKALKNINLKIPENKIQRQMCIRDRAPPAAVNPHF